MDPNCPADVTSRSMPFQCNKLKSFLLALACSVTKVHMEPHHQTEINRIEKVQRTPARWACRRWRNQSHVGEMLEELQWPELQEWRHQASLTFFYKIHNNLVTIDKDRYQSEAGNRSTRSHPFQYHRPYAYTDGAEIFFLPQDNCNFGMNLQPKLSLRKQLMGLSPKYNDLRLYRDMAWYACP